MFKFIHVADIHLDSPLLNLDQYEGAPVDSLRVATREAFDNVIRFAIEEQVHFVVIAGDLYDKDSPDFNTPQHVRKRFRELEQEGIRVYIIQGNHDAESTTKKSFSALTFPDNVHLFSTRKPETKILEDLGVAIHGQGFARRAVEEDLSANYPDAVTGHFNIGLLHTNVGGNESHDNYAPSNVEGLRGKDYQYWALGHIHKRRDYPGGPKLQIRYAGNTQGRHIRETGEKGCLLVSVNESHEISVRFQPTDVWRWLDSEVDATDLEMPTDVLDAIRRNIDDALTRADDRQLAIRVTLRGSCPCHRQLLGHADHYLAELRRLILDVFEDRVWIVNLRVKTSHPQATHHAAHQDSMHGELVAAIENVVPDVDVVDPIRDDLSKLIRAIPTDPRCSAFQLDLEDTDTVQGLVREAQDFLVAKLLDPTPSPADDA